MLRKSCFFSLSGCWGDHTSLTSCHPFCPMVCGLILVPSGLEHSTDKVRLQKLLPFLFQNAMFIIIRPGERVTWRSPPTCTTHGWWTYGWDIDTPCCLSCWDWEFGVCFDGIVLSNRLTHLLALIPIFPI